MKLMTHYSRTKLYGLLCTCLCFCLLPVRAQEMASNSNSLIVDARTEVICKSMTQSVERETRTVTILNKKGLDAAHFFCSCDMLLSLFLKHYQFVILLGDVFPEHFDRWVFGSEME